MATNAHPIPHTLMKNCNVRHLRTYLFIKRENAHYAPRKVTFGLPCLPSKRNGRNGRGYPEKPLGPMSLCVRERGGCLTGPVPTL